MKKASRSRALLVSAILTCISTASPIAVGHEAGSTISTEFSITGIDLVEKGPFEPGDVLAFELTTDLPKDQFHFIQISGECLAYPAEWHEGTEDRFINSSYSRVAKAVAVVSSGCSDGEHSIQEVMLVAKDNTYARLLGDSNKLPKYTISKGHFVSTLQAEKTNDSIDLKTVPASLVLAKKGELKILNVPRLTNKGQTISWTAIGACQLKRELGSTDLGGLIVATKPGTCTISANTPWGSHLFNPVNLAKEVSVFSSKAIKCQLRNGKKIIYLETSKCPKGYVKK
jgi:hypothetical protein